MNSRLLAMIVKELWAVLRDPRGRIILVVPPIIQLVLFSAAATLEVKNVTIGIYSRDDGAASREFISELAGSPNFRRLIRIETPQALEEAIDGQQAIAVVVIDQGFSRDIAARRPATIQAILDGRKSNAAQIVMGYLNQVAANTGATLRPQPHRPIGQIAATNWYNPNLDYLWFILPSLIVQIGAISAMGVTAQSVSRERELGSFDQLMVSPLRTWEVLVGKMMPPLLLGLFNVTAYLIIIPLAYGLHMQGSLVLFYAAMLVYLFAVIGLGMAISAVSRTQQQAFLGMFVLIVPMILLSGFASPVENMPGWLQVIAEADPLKHFLIISEGLFLKGMTAADVFANTWPIAVIGVVTMAVAVWQFRARVE
ncbi:MAG: ABC transporter permease [Novosphingobium sp.]